MADNSSIEGQWVPLADASDENMPLTKADFDDMVTNYAPTTAADHLPLRFGSATGNGPVMARVAALRRDGNKLSGQLVKVDPRFDTLYQGGHLAGRSTRSMAFTKAPEAGAAFTGYGIKPPKETIVDRKLRTQASVEQLATDDLLTRLAKAHAKGETIQFGCNDARVEFILEPPVRGYATRPRVSEFRFETNDEHLSRLAKERQKSDNISFGEALTQVAAERHDLTRPGTTIELDDSASAIDPNGTKLSRLAREHARAKKISFCDALTAVAAEHPELTVRARG